MARLALAALLLTSCATESVPAQRQAPGMQRLSLADTGTPAPDVLPAKHRPRPIHAASRSLRRSALGTLLFQRLAQCESASRWHINTGNGYYGGLQESQRFWDSFGGLAFAARPDLASELEQITVAERGLAAQGWNAWPTCSVATGVAS